MAINLEAIGKPLREHTLTYTDRDVMLYALSVGATPDELELCYEGLGPEVLPTFGVVPPFPALFEAIDLLGFDLKRVVHGEQDLILHAPIPAEGTLATRSEVTGIYQKGKHALALLSAQTHDAESGAPICTTVWRILCLGVGDFGGEPGGASDLLAVPEAAATFLYDQATRPEQALLYRLNGDRNPLHADPSFARRAGFEAPILHGLCTYGFAFRALRKHLEGAPVRRFAARFVAPVTPGDRLITEGWALEDGRFVLQTRRGDHSPVLLALAEPGAPA